METDKTNLVKYLRGSPANTKKIKNLRLKKDVQRAENRIKVTAKKTMEAEILLTQDQGFLEAEGMERTFKFRQDQIVKHLDIASARKGFQLELNNFGPYSVDYTRNGRHLLIGGRKGHVASFDWKTGELGMEVHLRETVHDIKWLHNESMFATAQKDYVYIYDNTGAEMHCLRQHSEVFALDFLPYHFLLTSVGAAGILRYQDTSIGTVVAEHKTKLGRCHVMQQNPWNAIMHLGHANGVVSMWSPNMSTPIVKMLCHKGPVSALCVDKTGNYMTTTGLDGQMKIWDIRKSEPVEQYYTKKPATSLSCSQKGLVAVGYGSYVTVWKDLFKERQKSPYMSHVQTSNTIHDAQFCPFDDVLGIGHTGGITSLIIPGAGEANFDALESNPFETSKQRQQAEVRALLDKIQPDAITMFPDQIGKVNPRAGLPLVDIDNDSPQDGVKNGKPVKEKKKMRGRSSSTRRALRKRQNIIDSKKEALRAKLEKEKLAREKATVGESNEESSTPSLSYALDRFNKKKSQ